MSTAPPRPQYVLAVNGRCPCCYLDVVTTAGWCLRCTSRTYCACGALVSCRCGLVLTHAHPEVQP